MLNRVLVPLDGSELAEKALHHARTIAAPGAEIILLAAIDPPEYISYSMYGTQPLPPQAVAARTDVDYPSLTREMTDQTEAYLEQVSGELREAGFNVRHIVEVGAPADVIIQIAESASADAIVMSTHGRSGLSRWILGSVTNKVLSATPCPVFVIPPHREK